MERVVRQRLNMPPRRLRQRREVGEVPCFSTVYARLRRKRIKVHQLHHVARVVDLTAEADAAGSRAWRVMISMGCGTGAVLRIVGNRSQRSFSLRAHWIF
jgi:hypothetical protein